MIPGMKEKPRLKQRNKAEGNMRWNPHRSGHETDLELKSRSV
ncbi:hypothetical protein HanPSC8_Chr06g0254161 [Helianthus annuus]|nr:hypothetical protein HanPSC8_Chr06g0254161 [Helianthus annuus]